MQEVLRREETRGKGNAGGDRGEEGSGPRDFRMLNFDGDGLIVCR